MMSGTITDNSTDVAAAESPGGPATRAMPADSTIGVMYGLGAYLWWGFSPLYFKLIGQVPAAEILAHRVLWAVPLFWGLILLSREGRVTIRSLSSRRALGMLAASTVLIACNWYTFIWAVAHDQISIASLGYFINPLVSVLLGCVILGERLRRLQTVSVGIAAIGVLYAMWQLSVFPTVALVLAFSFAFYGLLRKTMPVQAVAGLAVETTFLFPLAIVYLFYLLHTGDLRFGREVWWVSLLLSMGGIITATPLIWFNKAARRVRLTTVGFLQYVAPSCQLMLAVWAFGEPFEQDRQISFSLIWLALGLYSYDALRMRRQMSRLRTN